MPRTKSHKKRWTEVDVSWADINEEIENADHGMKTAVKKDIAGRLGLSIDQIHSALRSNFGPKKTIEQREYSSKEDAEAYEQNRRIAYLVAEQKEKMKLAGEGERELATERILNLLIEWEVEGADEVSVSTINRIIRDEFGYRQITPRTRHEAAYALQEVQVDFSFSKYFSIVDYDKELGDYILKASSTLLRYKEGDKRMRPMLCVMMDSYSRLRWHHCMAASGESGSNTTAFMINFFNREPDELVFRHVPWLFKMDNGPLAKSNEGKSFFQSIGRDVKTSTPYEKTGIGKAERSWQNIWQWEMEIVSRIGVGGLIPMNEYNALLLAECVRQQSLKHPFYSDQICVDLYQRSILSQHPRPEVISADLTDAVFTSFERVVGQDQLISIQNTKYEIPVMAGDHHHTTGQRIRVLMHRDGRIIGELIDRNAPTFEIQEFTPTQTGQFRTHGKTFSQQLNNHIKEGRAITDELRNVAKMTVKERNEHFAGPTRLMPASEELEVNSPFSATSNLQPPTSQNCSSKFQALNLVAEILKQEGISMNDELHDYFNDYVAEVHLNREAIRAEVSNLLQILNNNQTGT